MCLAAGPLAVGWGWGMKHENDENDDNIWNEWDDEGGGVAASS